MLCVIKNESYIGLFKIFIFTLWMRNELEKDIPKKDIIITSAFNQSKNLIIFLY